MTKQRLFVLFALTLLQIGFAFLYYKTARWTVQSEQSQRKLESASATSLRKFFTVNSVLVYNRPATPDLSQRNPRDGRNTWSSSVETSNVTLKIARNRGGSLKYKESMKLVRDVMRDSIYRYDRTMKLPLMQLTAVQQSRTFRITEARWWLKSQRLVVAAAVRNAMSGLESSVRVLRQLSDLFHSVTVVFVENDSTDNTRIYLHSLTKQSNDKFRVFLLGCGKVNSADPCHVSISYGSSGRQHSPGHWEQAKRDLAEESIDRGLVMAALRNIYLQFIYDRIPADLMLVLEADLKWRNWDLDSVAQGLFHFKAKQQLDSLCAFTIDWKNLHDPCTLIFFDNKHFYVDSGESQGPFIDRIGRGNKLFQKLLSPDSGHVPEQPVKVASCFQGAAFYRMSSLRAASAFYRYSEGEWHCEHSTLSMQLRENYLDTQMALEVFRHAAG